MTSAAAARLTGERGYAMAVLLVTLAIMSVAIGVAMPVWRTMVQRDKEEELIFRGRQYARAIGLFQRRFPNTYPPSFDVLVEQRYLRKKYSDPMTEDGEFQVLYQGSAFSLPGGRGASATGTGRQQGGAPSAFSTPGRGGVGPQGGVIGVVSASEEKSFRILDGRSRYNEWRFVFLPTAGAGRGGGVGRPGGRGGGVDQPGGRGGGVDQPGGRGRGVDQPGGRGRGVDQPGGRGRGINQPGGFGRGQGGRGQGRGRGFGP